MKHTKGSSRYKTPGEMPMVVWLQMLKAIDVKQQRHGISLIGKGWSIRGIMMMHLDLVRTKGGAKCQ